MEHSGTLKIMSYTASLRQNSGRKSWLVEFRHPLKRDKSGKRGKKVRKGLGDCSEEQAKTLVKQLNDLLQDESLWTIDTKTSVESRFDSRVIEIFYDDLDLKPTMYRDIRDQYIPLPARDSSHRVLLLGRTGAGKTTLLRQLIGSDHKLDRFPATSTNRTTTCEIEVIANKGDFSAVVTFMPESEVRSKIEELVSSAILEAVDGADDIKIARGFLEDRDQRFRLKYLLGDLKVDNQEEDPYADQSNEEKQQEDFDRKIEANANLDEFQDRLKNFIERIRKIADSAKNLIEKEIGSLNEISSKEKDEALDLLQSEVEESDQFVQLVSDIIEELRSKFSFAPSGGVFDKSPTGWCKAWSLNGESNRKKFIENIRYFSANSSKLWGRLITPLVTGIRVEGSFFPEWSQDKHPIVLIDTEGLGHKASIESNLSNSIVFWFDQVDVILLIDKATDSMANSVGKALESIAATGHTQKLMVVFTHMDALKGDNLSNVKAKKDHLLNSTRNIIENQIKEKLGKEVSHYLISHLEQNTFFLGFLDTSKKEDFNRVKPSLQEILKKLIEFSSQKSSNAFPDYSFDNLVLAIRDGIVEFRKIWKSLLDLEPDTTIPRADWRSIKALTRKYGEGLDDSSLKLRPTADLRNSLSNVISLFLDNPVTWNRAVTSEEQRTVIDQIKAKFTNKLIDWVDQQVQSKPRKDWFKAFSYNNEKDGRGSTKLRASRIEELYECWIPIPSSTANLEVQRFINDLKILVKGAIDEVKMEIDKIE